MKKLSIMTLTILILGNLFSGVNSVSAQDKKLSFGVNVGYGIPGGDFSSTDASKQPVVEYPSTDTTHVSGYAKSGFHFNVYGDYMFASVIGGMISIGGNMNSYDVATLNSNVATAYTKAGFNGTLPAFTVSGSYYVGQYLIGPYVSIPAGSKLRIEIKALVGLTSVNYPTLSYSYSFFGSPISETITVKSSSGFGYNFGAGIKYMVTDMVGLHFNVCYAGCSASYPSYTATASDGTNSSSQTHNTAMAMSLSEIQVTVGASIDR